MPHNHPKTGGIVHCEASKAAAKPSGNTLTTLPGRPPPVMCATALIPVVVFSAARTGFTYSFVGVSRLSPVNVQYNLVQEDSLCWFKHRLFPKKIGKVKCDLSLIQNSLTVKQFVLYCGTWSP